MTSIAMAQMEEIARCMPAHVTLREALPMIRLVARLGAPAVEHVKAACGAALHSGAPIAVVADQPLVLDREGFLRDATMRTPQPLSEPVAAPSPEPDAPAVAGPDVPPPASAEIPRGSWRPHTAWTAEREAELIRLIQSGARADRVAEALGCTPKAVQVRCTKLRAAGKLEPGAAAPAPAAKPASGKPAPAPPAPPRQTRTVWTSARDAELIRMIRSGASVDRMAGALGCTRRAIQVRAIWLRAAGKLEPGAAAPAPPAKPASGKPAPAPPTPPRPMPVVPPPSPAAAELADRLAKAVPVAGTGISAAQQLAFIASVLGGETPPVAAEKLGHRSPPLMARMTALFKASGLDPTRNAEGLARVMAALRVLAGREEAAAA